MQVSSNVLPTSFSHVTFHMRCPLDISARNQTLKERMILAQRDLENEKQSMVLSVYDSFQIFRCSNTLLEFRMLDAMKISLR